MLILEELKSEYLEKKDLSKKDILNYLEQIEKIPKDELSFETWQQAYQEVTKVLEGMKSHLKVNTLAYLQKEQKKAFAKKITLTPMTVKNTFQDFFALAYPEGKRDKSYTRVMVDSLKATEEQILHTFKYISNWSLTNKLSSKQIQELLPFLKRLDSPYMNKYILQIKSLEGLRKIKAFKEVIIKMGGK
jgi:hypothetical protein